MAPGQAVQQHDSFHQAVNKRKHLNMLIVDQCKEIDKIYGTGQQLRCDTTSTVNTAQLMMGQAGNTKGYAAGWSGSLMRPPAVPKSPAKSDNSSDVTQQQPSTSGQPGTHSDGAAAQNKTAALPGATTTTSMSSSKKWLLPRHTGDRETGKRMAAAVRSKRTPSGSFANLDLAKPPVCRAD